MPGYPWRPSWRHLSCVRFVRNLLIAQGHKLAQEIANSLKRLPIGLGLSVDEGPGDDPDYACHADTVEVVMKATYETDIVAWANQQAALLRAGKFSQLDIEHIADEVEDVGKSEQRELANRMAVLLAHLLKWQAQPERRGKSWEGTLREQRRMIERRLVRTPSLKVSLADPEWLRDAWSDARAKAFEETSIEDLPEDCPWSMDQIRDPGFYPG